MKLSGWTRLGIVVSVLWLAIASFAVWFQYSSVHPGDHSAFVQFVPGTEVDVSATYIDQKTGKEHKGIIWDVPALKWGAVAPFVFGPLGVIWLLIPGLVFVFRWVKAGFFINQH